MFFMLHFIFDVFFIFFTLFLLISFFILHKKKQKNSENLTNVLNKNIDLLLQFERKHEMNELKNNIQLYSLFQIVLKITKADYVSFFKYDFSQKCVVLNFILSIDDKGFIVQESELDDYPVASNFMTLKNYHY